MPKIGARVSAISLIPLLGLIGFSGLFIVDNWNRMAAAQQLGDEVTVALAVGEVNHQLQTERGVSAAFLADTNAQPDALQKQRGVVDQAVAKLNALGADAASNHDLAAARG
jgi:hypothetical protein